MLPNFPRRQHYTKRHLISGVSVGTAAIILASWLALSDSGLNKAGARVDEATDKGVIDAEGVKRFSANLTNQSKALDTFDLFGGAGPADLNQPTASPGPGKGGASAFAFWAAMLGGNVNDPTDVTSAFAANDVSWINPNGGNWNTASNWLDGVGVNRVPTSADNALINLAGTYTVTLDVNATVSTLTLGALSGTQTLTSA